MAKIPSKLMVELIEKILENDSRVYADLELFHAPLDCAWSVYVRTRRALRQALADGGYTAGEFDQLTSTKEFASSWTYGGLETYLNEKPRRDYA